MHIRILASDIAREKKKEVGESEQGQEAEHGMGALDSETRAEGNDVPCIIVTAPTNRQPSDREYSSPGRLMLRLSDLLQKAGVSSN